MSEKNKVPIKYTSRDFSSIKKDLIDYARRYYPDTYRDFSEASFGSLMIDTVAYVGDILSFYLDYQVNESLINTAVEYNNIVRQGAQFGYKFRGATAAQGMCDFYIKVPSNTVGMGPDSNYIPILKRGTMVSSTEGATFMLTEDLDFNNPGNVVVPLEQNTSTGAPTYWGIRCSGPVVSGQLGTQVIKIGPFERFRRVQIGATGITEILSVVDSEGHEYYEVDYLSQDVVYRDVVNRNANNPEDPPAILKPFVVPRRFTVENTAATTVLQFGYGSDSETNAASLSEPVDVVLDQLGRSFDTSQNFDPSRLLETDKFGVAPSDTNLTITYRRNVARLSNASAGTIVQAVSPKLEFKDPSVLNGTQRSVVLNSFSVYNSDPIMGSVANPSTDELRNNIRDTFASQNRAVTEQDYKAFTYLMPAQFGAIRRCAVYRDSDSFRRNLNFYVISSNNQDQLVTTNHTIKQNLKTWLGKNKMINDTIDILDAKIVNIQIHYTVTPMRGTNKWDLLQTINEELKRKYLSKLDIGEPFAVDEIYRIINAVPGVSDTTRVRLRNKTSKGYSSIGFNINKNLSADGRQLMVPRNVILEIKYLDEDIVGTIA